MQSDRLSEKLNVRSEHFCSSFVSRCCLITRRVFMSLVAKHAEIYPECYTLDVQKLLAAYFILVKQQQQKNAQKSCSSCVEDI